MIFGLFERKSSLHPFLQQIVDDEDFVQEVNNKSQTVAIEYDSGSKPSRGRPGAIIRYGILNWDERLPKNPETWGNEDAQRMILLEVQLSQNYLAVSLQLSRGANDRRHNVRALLGDFVRHDKGSSKNKRRMVGNAHKLALRSSDSEDGELDYVANREAIVRMLGAFLNEEVGPVHDRLIAL